MFPANIAFQVVRTLWQQQITKYPSPNAEWSEIWTSTFTQHDMVEGIKITANQIKRKKRRFRTADDAYRYCFGVMRKVMPVPDSKVVSDAKFAAASAALDRQIEQAKQHQ